MNSWRVFGERKCVTRARGYCLHKYSAKSFCGICVIMYFCNDAKASRKTFLKVQFSFDIFGCARQYEQALYCTRLHENSRQAKANKFSLVFWLNEIVHINAPLAAARHNPSKLGFCSRLAQTFLKMRLLAKLIVSAKHQRGTRPTARPSLFMVFHTWNWYAIRFFS